MTSPIDQIKETVNVVDYIKKYVALKPAGNSFIGFCPFHENTNTPAFNVFTETQSWFCFGCNTGGDIFEFRKAYFKEDFKTALGSLAEEAGIALSYDPVKAQQQADLYKITEAAANFFSTQLVWNNPKAGDYLIKRGITLKSCHSFGLGYAPGNGQLYRHLSDMGFSDALLRDAGVVSVRGKRITDYFYQRIIFPIKMNGNINSFAGRTITGDAVKFINGPTTEIFSKGKSLYGLSQAKQRIVETGVAVVVEGYIDVIIAHQAGFTNTVGAMGTAITRDQLALLRGCGAKTVVLAMDGDSAGEKAINRISSESGLTITVATLPEGKDPDEIILSSPSHWEQILINTVPLIEFLISNIVKEHGPIDNIDKKRVIYRKAIALIDMLPDEFDQAYYQTFLAQLLGIPNYTPNPRCPHCKKRIYQGNKHE